MINFILAAILIGSTDTMLRNLSEDQFDTLYPHVHQVDWEKPQGNTCRLILIRHGESTSNASEGEIRIAGRKFDVSLTEKGIAQAEKTAKVLAATIPGAMHATAIYSSPLKRALQTAEKIRQVFGVKAPPLPDEALLETWYAELEGADKEKYDPHERRQAVELRKLPSFEARMHYRLVDGMENLRDVFQRVTKSMNAIAAAHKGQTVVLTTHNGPIKSLFMHLAARDKNCDILYDSFDVGNASVLIFESDGESFELKAFDGLTLRKRAKL